MTLDGVAARPQRGAPGFATRRRTALPARIGYGECSSTPCNQTDTDCSVTLSLKSVTNGAPGQIFHAVHAPGGHPGEAPCAAVTVNAARTDLAPAWRGTGLERKGRAGRRGTQYHHRPARRSSQSSHPWDLTTSATPAAGHQEGLSSAPDSSPLFGGKGGAKASPVGGPAYGCAGNDDTTPAFCRGHQEAIGTPLGELVAGGQQCVHRSSLSDRSPARRTSPSVQARLITQPGNPNPGRCFFPPQEHPVTNGTQPSATPAPPTPFPPQPRERSTAAPGWRRSGR